MNKIDTLAKLVSELNEVNAKIMLCETALEYIDSIDIRKMLDFEWLKFRALKCAADVMYTK